MSKKNILIVNEYAGTPEYGMIHRHYYLAKEFIKQGYKVTIVTASYSHLLNKYPNMEDKKYKYEDIDGIDYLWVNVNKYDSANDKKRVLKWFNFSFKILFISKILKYKPDIVIWSSSSPFSGVVTYYLTKKLKAKFILEIRDIWPLTLIDIGKISPKHILVRLMSKAEKFIIEKSDIIVSNLQNYNIYLKDKGFNKKSFWISNGIDLDEMKKIESLDEKIKALIPKDKFIVGYTGKIGVSNAMQYIIEVSKNMQEYKDIIFVLVGSGQEEQILKNMSKDLNNVIFIPLIPKSQVQTILKLFDVCYIGWRKKDIYKYGVSPNKIFDYMYSSKPIVHSTNSTRDIVQLANCGLVTKAEDIKGIKEAIIKLYNMPKEKRKELGENGKKYVLEYFTYDKLAQKYIDIFEKENYI